MSVGTLIKVGVHLLKIGGKKAASKVIGKPVQLSRNERKALELIGKGPKIGKAVKKKKKDK
jgi:hypothetical protein